jgi:hypothetical protein
LQLYSHTPFTPGGAAILPFLKLNDGTDLNTTVSPEYRIFRQLHNYMDAANEAKHERSYKHHAADIAEYTALINIRAGNELWEKLVFDSVALKKLLQDIAGDFIWLGITARSWEASLDNRLQELIELIQEDEEARWRGDPTDSQALPIDSEMFGRIVPAVDSMVFTAQEHIRVWRISAAELFLKQTAARAQLEVFLTAMASEDTALGVEGLQLGFFFTPWMKEQLSRLRPEINSQARGFWLPETEQRFLLVQEMTAVAQDMAGRWDVVKSDLERIRKSMGVHAKTEKKEPMGWGWRFL